MNNEAIEKSYPGDESDFQNILSLAEAYRAGARALIDNAEKGNSLSYAPARLCSIHAIELCLNAFLRSKGFSNKQIRARAHNLADTAFVETLRLRKKTAAHLSAMTEKREYLVSRYAPEMANQHSELNRLSATLEEVMAKVAKYLASKSTGN